MSAVPEIQKTAAKGWSPSTMSALDEAAWQKWGQQEQRERDAARRRRLIRVLWLVLPLVFVCALVWWLAVSE
jgi:hypothetical protein